MYVVLDGSCDGPEDWKYYNGNCFFASTTKTLFWLARALCLQMGADLASISDQAEMDFVANIS